MSNFNDFHPKQRTGKECKKTDCDRHKNYVAWQCGTSSLEFCMNCKHAHISQYKRKVFEIFPGTLNAMDKLTIHTRNGEKND